MLRGRTLVFTIAAALMSSSGGRGRRVPSCPVRRREHQHHEARRKRRRGTDRRQPGEPRASCSSRSTGPPRGGHRRRVQLDIGRLGDQPGQDLLRQRRSLGRLRQSLPRRPEPEARVRRRHDPVLLQRRRRGLVQDRQGGQQGRCRPAGNRRGRRRRRQQALGLGDLQRGRDDLRSRRRGEGPREGGQLEQGAGTPGSATIDTGGQFGDVAVGPDGQVQVGLGRPAPTPPRTALARSTSTSMPTDSARTASAPRSSSRTRTSQQYVVLAMFLPANTFGVLLW